MPVYKRDDVPELGEKDVVMPGLMYDDGPAYFPGVDEQVEYLNAQGLKARRSHPDAPVGVVHFSFGVDFNGVLVGITMLVLQSPFQVFLGVLGNYLYDKMKSHPKHDQYGREFVPQIHIGVQRPDGTVVSIQFKGDAEQWDDFCKADHAKLFSTAAATGTIDPEGAKYVALHVRDVFHYPDCKHIRDNLEDGINTDLVGFASAQAAVHERRRPCKFCRPPWTD